MAGGNDDASASSARHLAMVVLVLIGVSVYAGWRMKKDNTEGASPLSEYSATDNGESPVAAASVSNSGGEVLKLPEIADGTGLAPPEEDFAAQSDMSLPVSESENLVPIVPETLPVEPAAESSAEMIIGPESSSPAAVSGVQTAVEDVLPVRPETVSVPMPSPVDPETPPVFEVENTDVNDVNNASVREDNVSSLAGGGGNSVFIYTVRPRDTLSKIAQKFLGSRKRAKDIFMANRDRMASPDRLVIGMKLRVPGAVTGVSPQVHIIKNGDTLPSLASKYYGGITPENIAAIRDANPALKRGGFKVGTRLVIPSKSLVAGASASAPSSSSPSVEHIPAAESFYIVRAGDTLSKVAARKYGNASLWRAVYKANRDKLSSPNSLRVGMKLRLP